MNTYRSVKPVRSLLALLLLLVFSVSMAVPALAEEITETPNAVVTWSNPNYTVQQNDKGENKVIGKNGNTIVYNGLLAKTTTTENADGTKTYETVRYTFKDGTCTDVKTTNMPYKPLPGTETKKNDAVSGTVAGAKSNEEKSVKSTKVSWSGDKYKVLKDGDRYVVVLRDAENTESPIIYNGLVIKTETVTYTDGSSQVIETRYNFKNGVNTDIKVVNK